MSPTIAVIGLGYVGLPVVERCATAGYQVIAADIDKEKVEAIGKGDNPLTGEAILSPDADTRIDSTTDNHVAVREADIIVVTVPTPIDENKQPNFTALKSVTGDIAASANGEELIIVESTVPPGTSDRLLKPLLEDHGLEVGEDIFLAHSPERIDPNNESWPLEKIPRVVGAISNDGCRRAVDFYESILESDIHTASSIEIAEASKILENTFRDINIAFVNELAQLFDNFNINIHEVIDLAATKPYGFMPFYPGAGVGGHCIPVDPYLLINGKKYEGFNRGFLQQARSINEQMPQYLIKQTESLTSQLDIEAEYPEVLLLGVAFKPDIDDIRGSPYFPIRDGLLNSGFDIETYDPWIPEHSSVESPYCGSDIVVVVTAHSVFESISIAELADEGVTGIIDGRNMFDYKEITKKGLAYAGIGKGVYFPDWAK